MSFLDSEYFAEIGKTAVEKLGISTGSGAVSTAGKVLNALTGNDEVKAAAAASQSTSPAHTVLGLTPTQLALAAGGLVLVFILLKKARK